MSANDGYPDLLVGCGRLFRNDGPPAFTFTELAAGLAGAHGSFADVDNDGDLDSLAPLASIRDVLVRGTGFAQAWILGGNVLTLVPFGFLLPFAAPRLATWPRMVGAALVFPVGIELAQLAVSLLLGYSYRATEVDDVLLNFAGVLIGYALSVTLRDRVAAPVTGDSESRRARGARPTGEGV